MNIENVVKSDKKFSLMTSMIFHNMQEIANSQLWLKLRGYFHYEQLIEAGITRKRYMTLLNTGQISVICYLVDEKNDLCEVLRQMEDLKEIYSPVPIRIAIQLDEAVPENHTENHTSNHIGKYAGNVLGRYQWIKGIELAYFSKNNVEEMLDWLARSTSFYVNMPTLRVDTNFYLKNSAYSDFLKNMNWEETFIYKNLYVGGFFRSLIISKELYYSIMLEYDFLEFMLSMVHYYYKAKSGESIKEQRILEYKEHAVEIIRLSKETPAGKKIQQEKININIDLSLLNDKISKYYGISVVGDNYNFLGMVDVLQKIRNRTRGHGVIVGKSGIVLWDILFRYTLMLVHFLDIGDFSIEVRENKVYAGYKNQEMICLEPFVIEQNDVPCILHQVRGKQKKEYINYFYGEYAIPNVELV